MKAYESTIDGDECWVCGEEFLNVKDRKKTLHHTIPKHLKPKRNMIVPICEGCHDKVTAEDPQAVVNFAYKAMKSTIEQTQLIGALVQLAEQRQTQLEAKK